jgi:hypothetical protein
MGESDCAESAVTSLLAAATDFGANAAMLMFVGVPFAFIRAQAAGEGAGFERRAEKFFVRACSPRPDRRRCEADVGAVEIETNALSQMRDTVFHDASVGAGNAGLRAIVAFFNAADQRVIGLAFYIRVGADHLLGVHRRSPAFFRSLDNTRAGGLF